MATKRHGNQQPKDNSGPWVPPRGIAYLKPREGAPKPYGLQWRVDGKRNFQFFENTTDREAAAKKLTKEREKHGQAIFTFSPAGWQEYMAAKEMAQGEDLRRIVASWLSSKTATINEGIPCSEAVEQYLKLRIGVDVDDNSDTERHMDLHLRKRFAKHFGKTLLGSITPDDIRAWLAGIISEKTGAPIGELAKRHHRKDLNTFFSRAVREGWAPRNPCELVAPPKLITKDVQILTPKEARDLLEANLNYPICGRLALEMFGGLRSASVERCLKEHIKTEEKGILMPGHLHKSQKRQYRQGHPDVLWAWIKHAGEAMWTEIGDWNYAHEKQKAFTRAEVTNTGNVLRHSFASYHLALNKSLHATGYFMTHTNGRTTSIYEGVAKEADAKEYFSLTPESIKGSS